MWVLLGENLQEKAKNSLCKKCTKHSGKDFKLVSFNKFSSLCQSGFTKHVLFSHDNESPKNSGNFRTYSRTNIIITPRSNKTNFHSNYNSIEMPYDHYTFLNSKYYVIDKLNILNNMANYFRILHLNIDSLNEHIDSLSYVFSMMKFSFPVIRLNQRKIR